MKTILITGCSAGGIGASLALALANHGHHVFATARNPSKIPASLTALSNVTTLSLDVTSAESVAAAAKTVSEVTERLSSSSDVVRGLDALVNNAGLGYTMPVLDVDVEEAQRVYDANVWGTVRMIQAFSGMLIAQKGRIVNVSSVGAALNKPWIGTYASSKAALIKLSETLRLELAPFNVTVTTIMLGAVDTPFHANEPSPQLPPTTLYASVLANIAGWANGDLGPKGSPVDEVAESLVEDVIGNGAGGLVWKGEKSGIVRFVSGWLPTFVVDHLIRNNHDLDKL